LAGQCGPDGIFAPTPEAMYPFGIECATAIEVPAFADILEGAARPGHFRGVASVVARLFNLGAPDLALFGDKDYQQLLVIRRMAAELFFPIEIIGVPTVREADGLALSSRNRYLTAAERERAPALYRALENAVESLRGGVSAAEVARLGARTVDAAGFRGDYFAVRDAETLGTPDAARERVVLAAARLGKARLIDKITVAARSTA
jgi:pantoate--beta-alanine ligase